MMQYLISTVFIFNCLLHPIHVSVTDIEYAKDENMLKITSHIFIDDMEKEIRKILDEPYLDITNPGKGRTSDEVIEPYIRKHFSLKVNGKAVDYKYLGHETEEAGAIYIYIEVDKVKKLKSISVRDEVLLDYYDDQVNMVHVKVDDELRSMKIDEGNREDELDYE